jgi:hypothetical protein
MFFLYLLYSLFLSLEVLFQIFHFKLSLSNFLDKFLLSESGIGQFCFELLVFCNQISLLLDQSFYLLASVI